ncbi:reverse transcriptase domain-containing protein [Tanacetum coccineum]|uniref:Reverse transcriptase domain-containing protein n=1 Tax=Tanacetum coccineum TaxID=301880 RepID=A0ABQ5BGS3_9ASTR
MEETSRINLNERCSAILLNEIPLKEKDHGSFTIPCIIGNVRINKALADLGANISLMPYSMFSRLGLGELKPTCMCIELANKTTQYPRGIADNIIVKIDKFVFPVDFVVLDIKEDHKILIILGRPFLALAHAMIDVFNKKISFMVRNKTVTFKIEKSMEFSSLEDDTYSRLFSNQNDEGPTSKPTLFTANTKEPKKQISKLKELPSNLEYAFLDDNHEFLVIISSSLSGQEKELLLQVLSKHKAALAWKIADIKGISPSFCTHKILMEDNFKPVMLKRLSRNEYYCFLDGFSEYFQIPLALEDQEKTTFTYPHETSTYRCEETNLVLNWEKYHFMVKEGIVLGHKISKSGIKVDRAKVDVIAKLPYPTNIKGVRSFLGHARFYQRFIKDFSKIARPMTQLLMKDAKFIFSDECIQAFNILKDNLTMALVIVAPDWNLDFELMCDASDYAVGAVLGQRIYKKFRPIYNAIKTMNDAQENYTTIEKELLAVVYPFDKF